MRDMIGFRLADEADLFGNWALMTGNDRDILSAAEIAAFELIAPHVRRAVEISRLLKVQRLAADSYRAVLAEIDSAVLILGSGRRLAFANPRAEQVLAAGTVLRLQDGQLCGATEPAERALRRATSPAEGGRGGTEAILTGTDGEERLLFSVGLDIAGDRPTLLVLRSPREDTRNPLTIAARTFALTPAQVQVLAFLTRGHAPDDIAGLLGLSVTTVRSHLAELFARSGTSRQAELVARTLSLASPLRSAEAGPQPA